MLEGNHQEVLAAVLLNRLFMRGKWKAAHMPLDKLQRGVPGHLRGDAKDVMKELIRENWVMSKPTSYGTEVSLNTKFRNEILSFIDEHLP